MKYEHVVDYATDSRSFPRSSYDLPCCTMRATWDYAQTDRKLNSDLNYSGLINLRNELNKTLLHAQ